MKSEVIGEEQYNLVIGMVLLYGFVLNVVTVLFARTFISGINIVALLVGYFILCLAGGIIVNASKNPSVSFFGYNLIVVPIGAVLALSLPNYPIENIIMAIVVTGITTLIMTVVAIKKPGFFENLGTALFFSLFLGVGIEFVAIMFGYEGDIFNWLFVAIFSLYIGFDWYRAQQYPKTLDNAVDSAVDLYLDIINLFFRLLSIISNRD